MITNYSYYYFNNALNKKEINNLNNEKLWKKSINDVGAKNVVKTSNVFLSDWKILKKYLNNAYLLFLNHYHYHWNFNIHKLNDKRIIIKNDYVDTLRGEYDWHNDSNTNTASDIKFTIIINISKNPYEGGKFYIMRCGQEYVKELDTPGNMIFFPSFLPHKVSPVTKGTRSTLTIFIMGPALC